MTLDNSTSPSSRILIGQFKRKPPESCEEDVTQVSKTKKIFFGWPWIEVLDCRQLTIIIL